MASHIKSMMAESYHERYFRVLVTGSKMDGGHSPASRVYTGLFLDIGICRNSYLGSSLTEEGVLVPSCVGVQLISARLWSIRVDEGYKIEARKMHQDSRLRCWSCQVGVHPISHCSIFNLDMASQVLSQAGGDFNCPDPNKVELLQIISSNRNIINIDSEERRWIRSPFVWNKQAVKTKSELPHNLPWDWR